MSGACPTLREHCRHRRVGSRCVCRPAFTLIELLVVIAIIALLVGMMVPSLRRARRQARIVVAHSDLRQITIALCQYAFDNYDELPPARSACGVNLNYQLPVELAEGCYLPSSSSAIPQSDMPDVFNPDQTYKYRAPGPIYFNGTLFDFPDSSWRPRAKVWVPDDFPYCASPEGRYYANRYNEPPSPVLYGVWSEGPDPDADKFPRVEGSEVVDDSRFPLPRSFWLAPSDEAGFITHFRTRTGVLYASP